MFIIISYLSAPRHALFLLAGNRLKHHRLFTRCRRGGSSLGFICLILSAFSPSGILFCLTFITILSAAIASPSFLSFALELSRFCSVWGSDDYANSAALSY